MFKLSHIFFVLASLLILYQNTYSQDPLDSQGRDFWFTFLPNYHNNGEFAEDSLYVFISANKATSGKIVYRDSSGQVKTQNFQITNPEDVYTFKVQYFKYELKGYSDKSGFVSASQTEKIALQYFNVTSDEDITVFAHSQASLTSEAFLVLPKDALNKEYMVLTYNSHGYTDINNSIIVGSTPSQFTVLAVEDNTTIDIQPSVATYVNGKKSQQITLNKGESYMIQARITNSNLYPDMTGSIVKSNKPVAVFAGHQRSALPIVDSDQTPSRDCLLEQMVPISALGRNSIVVPFAPPSKSVKAGNDLFRILAIFDSTVVKLNGDEIGTLSQGKFFEFALDAPYYIEASSPILVSQYKKSSNYQSQRSNPGDPLMLLMPPKEQYDVKYRIINAQAWDYNEFNGRYEIVYTEQYISIIAETSKISALKLDNKPIPQGLFRPVSNSGYSYANIPVTDGVHNLEGDSPFGVFVYGYGQANSYGYLGGMSFKQIDYNPPSITYKTDCFTISGAITDTAFADSKIISVDIDKNSEINVESKIDTFNKFASIVKFNAELKDKYSDGSFQIHAADSMGLSKKIKIDIPGFTVSMNKNQTSNIKYYNQTIVGVTTHCFDTYLYNYGKFEQKISKLKFKNFNSVFTFNPTPDLTIKPNDSLKLTICVDTKSIGNITDTLIIENPCIDRQVLAVNLITLQDSDKPIVTKQNDSCHKKIELLVADSLKSDYGIESIEILKETNCKVTKLGGSNSKQKVSIEIFDPYKDSYYKIVVKDKSGKTTEYEENVPGYTISFGSYETKVFDFGEYTIGRILNDTLWLYNYGNSPIEVDLVQLEYNILFSVPRYQIPFTIQPKDSFPLVICYTPSSVKKLKDEDILKIGFNCLTKPVKLLGKGTRFEAYGDSKCNSEIFMRSDSVRKGVMTINASPNPVINNKLMIKIENPQNQNVDIIVYDVYGYEISKIYSDFLAKGEFEFSINTDDIKSGNYVIVVNGKEDRLSKFITIIK